MLNAVGTRADVQDIVADDVIVTVRDETGTISGKLDALEERVRRRRRGRCSDTCWLCHVECNSEGYTLKSYKLCQCPVVMFPKLSH